jgi:hypothetical protein
MSYLLLESGAHVLLEDDVSHLLLEGGGVALLITRQLSSSLLAPGASSTPWSIDPERTQLLTELTTPGETTWSEEYSSTLITTSPAPTPWSIDPERTQQL